MSNGQELDIVTLESFIYFAEQGNIPDACAYPGMLWVVGVLYPGAVI